MKQVIRKGLKDIIVDEVPDPALLPHHVLVRPLYSLISSGTETASIHRDSLLTEVAGNPSHLRKIWDVAMKTGPMATIFDLAPGVIERVADTVTPQPVLAVIGFVPASIEDVAASSMVLVCADVRDPGNAGTVIRKIGRAH